MFCKVAEICRTSAILSNFQLSRGWRIYLASLMCSVLAFSALTNLALADEPHTTSASVLAFVGQQPITVGEVDFQLGRDVADRNLKPLPQSVLQATIDLVGRQRQALHSLSSTGQAVSQEEVEKWIFENMQPDLAQQLELQPLLDKLTKRYQISEASLRDSITFRLSWKRYLEKYLTEENLAKHFKAEKERFDGTSFHIESVAIAVPAGQSSQRTRAYESLKQLQAEWAKSDVATAIGALLSADASLKKSDLHVDDLRWIKGAGSLDPVVVSGLLKLEVGKVSEPLDASTAVYLVRLDKKQAGSREFETARDEVRLHLLVYLLNFLAERGAKQLPLRTAQ